MTEYMYISAYVWVSRGRRALLRRRSGLRRRATDDRYRHILTAELLRRGATGHEEIDFAALDRAAAVLHRIHAVVTLQPADTNHSPERQDVRIRGDDPSLGLRACRGRPLYAVGSCRERTSG